MLTVSQLSCRRGDRRLFSHVSFTLASGQWLHLEGDNGVGKTSLMRLICGLGVPEEGDITWRNEQASATDDDEPQTLRNNLIYLGHQLAIKEDLTPLENLRTHAAISGTPLSTSKAMAALAQMGLRGREQLPVKVLSQGQKRRSALARLIVSEVPLWVLDEPFVALDGTAQQVLRTVINSHLSHGGMVLLTSHQAVSLDGQGRVYRLSA